MGHFGGAASAWLLKENTRGQRGKHRGFPITSIAMSRDCENDVKIIILSLSYIFKYIEFQGL